MRLLFLSLEFSAGTFSGNGVYAQSQVRALAALGHSVAVVSGRPPGPEGPLQTQGASLLLQVELPRWGTLDRTCAWEQLAAGAAGLAPQLAAFAPQAALGVDWSSLPAYRQLAAALAAGGHTVPPYVYLNYRVYLRTAGPEDQAFMRDWEGGALAGACLATALSRSDAAYLSEHLQPAVGGLPVQVLLPALRSDMASLPPPPDTPLSPATGSTSPPGGTCAPTTSQADTSGLADGPPGQQAGATPQQAQQCNGDGSGSSGERRRRRYLTCCVRLSPEKEPHRFVALVEALAAGGHLGRLGLTPLLAASTQGGYAEGLRARLRAAAPHAVLEQRFLGPADLARVYAETALNVHPPLYDAYGMTVVEAASQGAPSLVQGGGAVGATDLLSGAAGQVVEADLALPPEQLADQVAALLVDEAKLRAVGAAAAARARSWTEEANAAQLARLVQQALTVTR